MIKGEIIIYNVLGVVIDRIKITNKDIVWDKEVPRGIYFARIEKKDKLTKDAKFIVVK